jgi:predicted Zn-dependent protease
MADLSRADDLFFTKTGMDRGRVEKIVAETMAGMDDGELFLEWSQSEALALDDGRIKSASFDQNQGFGLRALSGEAAGYAHASELSEDAIRRAGETVRAVQAGHSGTVAAAPIGTNRMLYTNANPLTAVAFAEKTKLLMEIDAYRSTRRCARRWSISNRCRRRPARWTVVLGPGWPGVMLHEAVGHGLEGRFQPQEDLGLRRPDGPARGGPGVTVVDDGTHGGRAAARSPSTTRARRPTAPC